MRFSIFFSPPCRRNNADSPRLVSSGAAGNTVTRKERDIVSLSPIKGLSSDFLKTRFRRGGQPTCCRPAMWVSARIGSASDTFPTAKLGSPSGTADVSGEPVGARVRLECPLCANRDRRTAAKASLFDHLVRQRKQRVRHNEIRRFGGFQVEHEQVARRQFERQVGGLRAFENTVDQRGGTIE
jgi:hypothetical protein